MKKILALIILSAMTVSFFSACGKQVIEPSDDTELIDFRGDVLKFYIGEYTAQITKKGGSASEDREYDRFLDTQKQFNFRFDFVNVANVANTFLAGSLSGGMRADFLKANPKSIYESYMINTLIPAENVVNDASSDKWRTAGQQGCGIFDGKKYGIFPYYWETSPSISGFINLNLTTMSSYNIPTPHETIEAGEWDWDHFRDFLQQTSFKDGEIEWKGLGNLAPSGECMLPFIIGNGGSYMTYSNGRYKTAIDSDESMEAMRFVESLIKDKLLYDIPTDDEEFGNGLGCMLWSGDIGTSEIYDMAYVRYPYGPNGSKDIVSTISHGDSMYAFPVFSAYTEDEIGAVTEYLFEPLSELYPNGWKDIYEDKVFFYHEDYEYYLRSVEEAVYLDNAALEESYTEFRTAMWRFFLGSSTPEAAVESVADIIQADIDEHYNKQ